MKRKPIHINKWLLPLSWLYGIIVFIRNKFFDWKILKQEKYDVPIICVGNITVGGTGKTPHTEYLIKILKEQYKVAVLSRGYKRKKKGFILATQTSTSYEIGDEPYQIKSKFPDIQVAVDANRRRAINKLLGQKMADRPDVIILDDAFQHRYVVPSFSIVLTDYNRPIYEDKLLPAGRLREPVYNIDKANVIIVTKCPETIKPIDLRIISHDLVIYPYQSLCFTQFVYKDLVPVFNEKDKTVPLQQIENKTILLVSGIASPITTIEELKKHTENIEIITFGDHHNFTKNDIKTIEKRFRDIQSKEKIIITTEKDATRLVFRKDLSNEFKDAIYYLPIEVSFLSETEQNMFNENLICHVKKNSRDGCLHQKQSR